ncbi:MAG: UDP-N-acetylmuramate dehydrogenase [Bacteroidales bacterium]
MRIEENFSLLNYNTFHIDAQTRYFVEYDNEAELGAILSDTRFEGLPLFHIGGGSNLLFTKDYAGVILHSNMKAINLVREDEQHVYLYAESGVTWDDFVAYCVARTYYGAENLSLIPGEVGSSAIQNIGAYGIEAKDIIGQVHCIALADGKPHTFDQIECAYGYRQSKFKSEWKNKYIVTGVTFCLNKQENYTLSYGNLQELLKDKEINLELVRQTIIEVRESKLPDTKVLGNAGSYFMNPFVKKSEFDKLKEQYPNIPSYFVDEFTVKVPAGWLIEQCGWKGKSLGHAAVHDKQALVLVNKGGATAQEIVDLAANVVADVKAKFGIAIHPEVIYI